MPGSPQPVPLVGEDDGTRVARGPRAERRGEHAPKKHRNPVTQFLGELPGLIVMAFVLALLIKTFLVQAFYILSGSMEPTLVPGDRVLVLKVPYYFSEPDRATSSCSRIPDPSGVPDRGLVSGFFHWMFEGLGVQRPTARTSSSG